MNMTHNHSVALYLAGQPRRVERTADPSFKIPTGKLILPSFDSNGRITFAATSTNEPPETSVRGSALLNVERRGDQSDVTGLSSQPDARKGGDQ